MLTFTKKIITREGYYQKDNYKYSSSFTLVDDIVTGVECNVFKTVLMSVPSADGGTAKVQQDNQIGTMKFYEGRINADIEAGEKITAHLSVFEKMLEEVQKPVEGAE